jgi:hypothetical protein
MASKDKKRTAIVVGKLPRYSLHITPFKLTILQAQE